MLYKHFADVAYLFVSQHHHWQMPLHLQQELQFLSGQREALAVGGVHHVHQDVRLPQVLQPIAPQLLVTPDYSAETEFSCRFTIIDVILKYSDFSITRLGC